MTGAAHRMRALPPARSQTHAHMAAVIASELERRSVTAPSIVDVGCGNGHLIAYLAGVLRDARVQGFDVVDSGHVVGGFPASTV